MTIKLETGKYYKTRDGRVVGPMNPFDSHNNLHPFEWNEMLWTEYGIGYEGMVPEQDIVEECQFADANNNQKMTVYLKLKDMEEIDQLKIRVAFLEGKHVQYYESAFGFEGWTKFSGGQLDENLCYRVHEEPKYLPLKVGKTYRTKGGNEYFCIYVEDDLAWMKNAEYLGGAAYTWGVDTGKAQCLGVDDSYDVIRVV